MLAVAPAALAQGGPEVLGPGPVDFELKVNGAARKVRAEPRATLLEVLRNDLGMTGPKEICDLGACGGCTVLLDGRPHCACMTLAIDATGRSVTTVEGLRAADGSAGDLQRAFVEKDALQCGFCTSGMVTSCAAVLAANPDPSAEQVRAGISGNLCRCGTYTRVVEAVLSVASLRKKGAK
ncbi:MAG: Nicotinate dehydrogenase subunit A [Planctomycetes bacterium]|nr:Nicotinate dehydrogenase subunit A [Planctomycetota bacterium]